LIATVGALALPGCFMDWASIVERAFPDCVRATAAMEAAMILRGI
jgi:hypothetical protein